MIYATACHAGRQNCFLRIISDTAFQTLSVTELRSIRAAVIRRVLTCSGGICATVLGITFSHKTSSEAFNMFPAAKVP
jgi:hypothetical protein